MCSTFYTLVFFSPTFSSNPRTDGGRADIRHPEVFFVDNGKTAARSAAKFGMAIYSSLLHTMCKL